MMESVSGCGVPEMLGIGLCRVRLYVNRPITPQIRYPVIAYDQAFHNPCRLQYSRADTFSA